MDHSEKQVLINLMSSTELALKEDWDTVWRKENKKKKKQSKNLVFCQYLYSAPLFSLISDLHVSL